MNADSCDTCLFFVDHTCRRHAPRATVQHDNPGSGWAFWPLVAPTQWCGEFKPAPRKVGVPRTTGAPP